MGENPAKDKTARLIQILKFALSKLVLNFSKIVENIKTIFSYILICISASVFIFYLVFLFYSFIDTLPISEFAHDFIEIRGADGFTETPEIPINYSSDIGYSLNTKIKVHLKRFIANELRIEGSLEIDMPKEVKKALWDGDLSDPKPIVNNWKDLVLREKYKNLNMMVHIIDRMPPGYKVFSIPVPLKKFFSKQKNEFQINQKNKIIVPINLYLVGEPDKYPKDWYWHNSEVSLELPPQVIFIDVKNEKLDEAVLYLPIEAFVKVGCEIQDYDIKVKKSKKKIALEIEFNTLLIRKKTLQIYTYLMAFLPVILGSILFYVIMALDFSSKSTLLNFFVASSSSILSVIPLKLVLTPPGLQGILLSDLILGFGIVTIFSALLIGIAVYVRST